MLTAFDLLLIALDYLGFLIEPFIGRIQRQLNFEKRPIACAQRPWLGEGAQVELSLAGLSLEIGAYHDMHRQRFDADAENSSSATAVALTNRHQQQMDESLLKRAKQSIQAKWPWVSFHLVALDPIVRLVNWMDCDMCLIDDWDPHGLVPEFDFGNEQKYSKTTSRASDAKSRSSLATDGQPDGDDKHADGGQAGLRQRGVGERQREVYIATNLERQNDTSANKDARDNSGRISSSSNNKRERVGVKTLYSSPRMRKSLLLVVENVHQESTEHPARDTEAERTGQQQSDEQRLENVNQRTAERQQQQQRCLFCMVKFYTIEDLLLFDSRSNLVFYHTQEHPELASLFLIVSSLLERARLMEPSGRLLAPGTLSKPDHLHCHSSVDKIWLDSVELSDADSDEDANFLSRYALLLMLAAYLNGPEAREVTRGPRKHLLGSLLMGFLFAFSKQMQPNSSPSMADNGANKGTSCLPRGRSNNKHSQDTSSFIHCVRPIGKQTPFKLELVHIIDNKLATKLDDGQLEQKCESKTGGNKFVDKQNGCSLVVLDPLSNKLHQQWTSQVDEISEKCANLTKNLATWTQISDLFGRLANWLDDKLADRSATNEKDNDENGDQPEATSSFLLELFTICGQSAREINGCIRLSKTNRLGQWINEQLGQNRQQNQATSSGQASESGAHRKILMSAFYLALILLVRNAVVNYLECLQRDLKDQARDEFIMLKRTVFEHEPQIAQLDDEDKLDLEQMSRLMGQLQAGGDQVEHEHGIYSSYDYEFGPTSGSAPEAFDSSASSGLGSLPTGYADAVDGRRSPKTTPAATTTTSQDGDPDEEAQLMEALISGMLATIMPGSDVSPEDLMSQLLGSQGDGNAGVTLKQLSEALAAIGLDLGEPDELDDGELGLVDEKDDGDDERANIGSAPWGASPLDVA